MPLRGYGRENINQGVKLCHTKGLHLFLGFWYQHKNHILYKLMPRRKPFCLFTAIYYNLSRYVTRYMQWRSVVHKEQSLVYCKLLQRCNKPFNSNVCSIRIEDVWYATKLIIYGESNVVIFIFLWRWHLSYGYANFQCDAKLWIIKRNR